MRNNKRMTKRLKNGGKILFSAFQIVTSLPTVVPTIPLAEKFKQAISYSQFLNLNVFQLVAVGCMTDGFFNYYFQVSLMSLVLLVGCLALLMK